MFDALTRLGASGVADAYEIQRSLRFNDDDSPRLDRAISSAGNRKTWTFSCWFKLGNLTADTSIFAQGDAGSQRFLLGVVSHELLFVDTTGSPDMNLTTAGLLRDPAAWYHVVIQYDTTQATDTNRCKMYLNGSIPTFKTSTYQTQNTDGYCNSTVSGMRFGANPYNTSYSKFDGYLAEVHHVDGSIVPISTFGETNEDTGQWVPKEVTGVTYGTNGFYLDFSDNSGVTATTLGKDSSGNGNNFTPTNLSVSSDFSTNDSFVDTPTANYATLNLLQGRGSDHSESGTLPTFSQGHLYVSGGQTNDRIRGTIALKLGDTGKYYFEVKAVGTPGSSNCIGFQDEVSKPSNQVSGYLAHWSFNSGNDLPYKESGSNPGWTAGDILGVAINTGTSKVTWYKNNSSVGVSDLSSSSMEYVVPYIQADSGIAFAVNFGGNGSFNYTPPADHLPITAQNLPEPTIKKPSEYFNTGIYTGDGNASRAITGVGFQPNKVVVKVRNVANKAFQTYDSVRGANETMHWNELAAESTSTDRVMSFDSDGFTLGDNVTVNQDTKPFVYWAWKESVTAGFDIVGYSGDGNDGRSVSHSLGVIPEMMITKRRTNSDPWAVYHKDMDADEYVMLNSLDDDDNFKSYYSGTRPTSSVFTLGDNNGTNGSGQDYITYLWSSVAGFSRVGSYTGNDSNDGIFLNLGFRPAFFLVKNTNDNEHWALYDDVRGTNQDNPYAVTSGYNNGVELTDLDVDILSNGIKFRAGHNRINYAEGGSAYIYLAMARSPFKYSNAR